MRTWWTLVVAVLGCARPLAPAEAPAVPPVAPPFDATPWVDPLIGTGGHGHTFPGATVPFGMVQLSPDTRLTGWDGCSGYHHDDEYVYGFSHTHLSGTGCSDYGDILLMPTVGESRWNNGADGKPGYRSHFSHANETASAGYYSVLLDDSGVKAELTATTRVGVHRYTFPRTDRANVIIDIAHRDEVIDSGIEFVGDREVRGFRRSRAWAQDQHVYFVARFSMPIGAQHLDTRALPAAPAKVVKASLRFDLSGGAPLVVKVGISAVDVEGAARNLDAECPGFDFDAVRDAAREAWRRQLGKIEITGGTEAQRRTFYTALYHCSIAPNVFSDVDGRYRGRDMKIHEAKGWTQYTVFSLWDTFRALHPLMTILEPQRTNDWINTFIAQYREGGALPVWELAANETDCMIGYHAVPVIADAFVKGIRGYDADAAIKAMVASAHRDVRGLPAYRKRGFVPSEVEGESVSKTLEYAYDDWCIAETMRVAWGTRPDKAIEEGAHSWRNLFDPSTGFFRPRRNNAWIEPFDPAEVNFHLTEANSWQYSLFVPHDLAGLTALLGGREKLAARLDALFTAPSATKGRDQADISGMIGQYAHGNEPSHHMAYLYDFAGEPWKTQERVRQIMDTLYSDRPDGLCGNEDCGQMSAWYVFSALGFYPVCPGLPEYAIGTPLFQEATIRLDRGRSFTVRARGEGPYVQSANCNGRDLASPKLDHAELAAGGELAYEMGSAPSSWGGDSPLGTGYENWMGVPVPIVTRGERVFHGAQEIALGVADGKAAIEFSLDGGKTFARYERPFQVGATTDLTTYAWRDLRATMRRSALRLESQRASAHFVRIPHDWTLRLAHPYAPQYAANGATTLIDGLRGGGDFRTGDWQGFQGVDVDATIDLGAVRAIDAVRAGFLRDVGSWIWFPTEVRLLLSEDGTAFRDAGVMATKVDEHETASSALVYEFKPAARARFVRVVARNRGVCPDWHPGAGHKAWLFADEIGIDAGE